VQDQWLWRYVPTAIHGASIVIAELTLAYVMSIMTLYVGLRSLHMSLAEGSKSGRMFYWRSDHYGGSPHWNAHLHWTPSVVLAMSDHTVLLKSVVVCRLGNLRVIVLPQALHGWQGIVMCG